MIEITYYKYDNSIMMPFISGREIKLKSLLYLAAYHPKNSVVYAFTHTKDKTRYFAIGNDNYIKLDWETFYRFYYQFDFIYSVGERVFPTSDGSVSWDVYYFRPNKTEDAVRLAHWLR